MQRACICLDLHAMSQAQTGYQFLNRSTASEQVLLSFMLTGNCGCSVLHKVAGREASFEEQTTAIREFIAGLLEEEEDWGEAAKVCMPRYLHVLDDAHESMLHRCVAF